MYEDATKTTQIKLQGYLLIYVLLMQIPFLMYVIGYMLLHVRDSKIRAGRLVTYSKKEKKIGWWRIHANLSIHPAR